MSFFVFTCIGIAAGLIYMFLPLRHHMGVLAAIVLGGAGAWSGALLAATDSTYGWAQFGSLAAVGSVAGAIGAIAIIELAARWNADRSRA